MGLGVRLEGVRGGDKGGGLVGVSGGGGGDVRGWVRDCVRGCVRACVCVCVCHLSLRQRSFRGRCRAGTALALARQGHWDGERGEWG